MKLKIAIRNIGNLVVGQVHEQVDVPIGSLFKGPLKINSCFCPTFWRDSINLRGTDKFKHHDTMYLGFPSNEEAVAYISKVIKTLKAWAESLHEHLATNVKEGIWYLVPGHKVLWVGEYLLIKKDNTKSARYFDRNHFSIFKHRLCFKHSADIMIGCITKAAFITGHGARMSLQELVNATNNVTCTVGCQDEWTIVRIEN